MNINSWRPGLSASGASAIVGVRAYGFIDLEGAKVSAIIVEYGREILARSEESRRGKLGKLKNPWLGRDANGKVRNGSGTAGLNSAQFTPHGPDPAFGEGWSRCLGFHSGVHNHDATRLALLALTGSRRDDRIKCKETTP